MCNVQDQLTGRESVCTSDAQLIMRVGLLHEVKHAVTQHAASPQLHHINMHVLTWHSLPAKLHALNFKNCPYSQRMRTMGALFVSMRLSRCLRGLPRVSMWLSRGLRCMAGRWRVSESRVSRVCRVRGQAGANGQQDVQAAVGDHNIAGGRRDVGAHGQGHKVIAGQIRWRHKVRRQRQHLQREVFTTSAT